MRARSRLLLVVDPAMYESVLSFLLSQSDVDHVICSHGTTSGVEGTYDVTVVTGDVPTGVTSRIVIQLPATLSGTGDLRVSDGDVSQTVSVTDLRQVFEAIDAAVPSDPRRTDALKWHGAALDGAVHASADAPRPAGPSNPDDGRR